MWRLAVAIIFGKFKIVRHSRAPEVPSIRKWSKAPSAVFSERMAKVNGRRRKVKGASYGWF